MLPALCHGIRRHLDRSTLQMADLLAAVAGTASDQADPGPAFDTDSDMDDDLVGGGGRQARGGGRARCACCRPRASSPGGSPGRSAGARGCACESWESGVAGAGAGMMAGEAKVVHRAVVVVTCAVLSRQGSLAVPLNSQRS